MFVCVDDIRDHMRACPNSEAHELALRAYRLPRDARRALIRAMASLGSSLLLERRTDVELWEYKLLASLLDLAEAAGRSS
jgi:hypothetical protein